ncbi:hypothetical protein PRUPE_3G189200 [Prunus persica]|uniref:Uncharacterized protein n=1 Tax=Prunus persica TaxID=3760 RepID=M5WXJ8_PRUPE|nr:hypothetical protein PRUPE_3G189200 [Prunus persica]
MKKGIIKGLTARVPMICWPFFDDQRTNCYYTCNELGRGIEIDNNVKRDEVEMLVRELMERERRKLAENATDPHGQRQIQDLKMAWAKFVS